MKKKFECSSYSVSHIVKLFVWERLCELRYAKMPSEELLVSNHDAAFSLNAPALLMDLVHSALDGAECTHGDEHKELSGLEVGISLPFEWVHYYGPGSTILIGRGSLPAGCPSLSSVIYYGLVAGP